MQLIIFLVTTASLTYGVTKTDLFKSARENGFENATREIEETIELVTSSGALESARSRAGALLDLSAETILKHFGKSEAADLIVYMIKNFA